MTTLRDSRGKELRIDPSTVVAAKSFPTPAGDGWRMFVWSIAKSGEISRTNFWFEHRHDAQSACLMLREDWIHDDQGHSFACDAAYVSRVTIENCGRMWTVAVLFLDFENGSEHQTLTFRSEADALAAADQLEGVEKQS